MSQYWMGLSLLCQIDKDWVRNLVKVSIERFLHAPSKTLNIKVSISKISSTYGGSNCEWLFFEHPLFVHTKHREERERERDWQR